VEVGRIGGRGREARVEGRLTSAVGEAEGGRIARPPPTGAPHRGYEPREHHHRDPPSPPHPRLLPAQSSSSFPRSSVWPAPTFRSSRFSSMPLSLSNGTRLTV